MSLYYRRTRPIPHHMYQHLHVCVCVCDMYEVVNYIHVHDTCGSILYMHIILQQMSETSAKHFSLNFNCGFVRCAICELTPKVGNSAIDKQQRMTGFQELFKDCPDYGIPMSYFDASSNRSSLFNRHCDKVIEGWSKKWYPSENRLEYERTFSTANWKALTALEKQKHPCMLSRMLQ